MKKDGFVEFNREMRSVSRCEFAVDDMAHGKTVYVWAYVSNLWVYQW